jgi:hypothetical protein
MTINEINKKISELAKIHAANDENNISDIKDAEFLEISALELIIDYCEDNKYLINGFPTEKRKLAPEELDDDDYFSMERFYLYLDILACQKQDVAELTWHFVSAFWPESYESMQDYLDQAKERIDCIGFYDVTL